MSNVGFIGLGAMGTPMARNVMKGGHALTVYARRPDAMAPLVNAGARGAASAAEVASRSDVIITMVIDTAAVEEVILGSRGVAEGARAGSVVIDHSTIDPDGARRIASALKPRGDEHVLERCRPLLECYGKTIAHIGPSGAGQVLTELQNRGGAKKDTAAVFTVLANP